MSVLGHSSDNNYSNNNSDVKMKCSRCHKPLKDDETRICNICRKEIGIGEWAKL